VWVILGGVRRLSQQGDVAMNGLFSAVVVGYVGDEDVNAG